MINRTPRVNLLLLGLLSAALVVLEGCNSSTLSPSTEASSTASPSPVAIVDAAGFATATCSANDELNLAFGNTDANVKSAAWKAFDSAVAAKDPTQIDATAGAVLSHLEAARVANARGATWTPGTPANAELAVVLVGMEKYIVAVQQARGEPGVEVQAAKDMGAIWPHLQSYYGMLLKMMAAKTIPLTQLPC